MLVHRGNIKGELFCQVSASLRALTCHHCSSLLMFFHVCHLLHCFLRLFQLRCQIILQFLGPEVQVLTLGTLLLASWCFENLHIKVQTVRLILYL